MVKNVQRGMSYFHRVGGRCYKRHGSRIAVLRQVLTESVAIDKHSHTLGTRPLTTQLVRATASKGRHCRLQRTQVTNHIAEASARADGFLPHNFGRVDTGYSIEFRPRLNARFCEVRPNPRLALVSKLQRCVDSIIIQLGKGLPSYPPNICQIEQLQSLSPFLVAVYHTYSLIASVFLRKLTSYLSDCL